MTLGSAGFALMGGWYTAVNWEFLTVLQRVGSVASTGWLAVGTGVNIHQYVKLKNLIAGMVERSKQLDSRLDVTLGVDL